MKRAHNSRLAALALDVPEKWIDNALSHVAVRGVEGGRKGCERRITDEALLTLAVARLLSQELGLSLARAVDLAHAVLDSDSAAPSRIVLASRIVLEVPLESIKARLRERIVAAAESMALVPRGRPPKRRPPE